MDELPTDGFRHQPAWFIAVAGLVLAQAGFALALFGCQPSNGLTDDRPIVSGRHPLHLYHGSLGSQTFYRTGATACFDPTFQAGYPKTPVFDGGSRPAELFLALAGGGYKPTAYKLGVFVCLMLVPLAFVLAARGAGIPAPAACLAGVGGILLTWSAPIRRLVDAGDLDVYAVGLAALVFVAWMARYTKSFGIDSWLVLAGVSMAGWYAHPLIWMSLFPLAVLYYLVYAPRHGLAWHLGLLGFTAVGLAPNLWWLWDWGRYWWLRHPYPVGEGMHPAWGEVIGTPADYIPLLDGVPGGMATLLAGVAGVIGLARAGHHAAAWLLPSAVMGSVLAVRLSETWAAADGVIDSALPLAAGFILLPAAFAIYAVADRARLGGALTAVAVLALVAVGWVDGARRPVAGSLGLHVAPLPLGLTPEQDEIVAAISRHTSPEARILWDEPSESRAGWNWSALLPHLTGRSFLGGLDPDAGVEHWFCGQINGKLNGRPLDRWTDGQLTQFCHLYNVGWVVSRSPAALERWNRFPLAKPVAKLKDGDQDVVLFVLDRQRSFVLSGTGQWDEANARRICLSNVTPDEHGWVVLSLHYQPDMKVYPSYVLIEPKKDAFDPVPLVQLYTHGPVPRVMLVWEP